MPGTSLQMREIRLLVAVPLLVGMLLISPLPSKAASLGVNARLQGNDGTTEEQRAFHQNYSLDLAQQAWLTNALQLHGAMRYNRSIDDGHTGQTISPALRLDLKNDFFTLDLNGNASRTLSEDESDSETRGWEANWQSRWPRDLMPGVHLNVGQRNTTNDDSPATVDNTDSHGGASVDWTLSPARLSYTYQTTKHENGINGRESLSSAHTGRLFADRGFLDNRLRMTFSQTASHRAQEDTAPVEGGLITLPVVVLEARSGNDITPLDGPLPALNGALIDNDNATIASIISPLPAMLNIVVKTSLEPVHKINLYTLDDDTTVAGSLAWDIYTSNDALFWTLAQTSAATTYNSSEKRFTISTNGIDREYIKLVARSGAITDIEITEITLWRAMAASGMISEVTSAQEAFGTSLGMNFEVKPNINLNYNLTYQRSHSSYIASGTNRGMNGGLSWHPSDTLSFSAQGAVEERQRDGGDTSSSRSIGTDAQWQVLPTVDLALGLTVNQSYTASHKDNQSEQLNASVGTELYKDLNARWSGSVSKSQSYASNTDSSTSYGTDLLFTSRLLPTLFGSLQTGFSDSDGDSPSTTTLSTILNWRPSDMFGARNSFSTTLGETNSSAFGLAIDLAPTNRTQFSAGYNYQDSTTTSSRYNLSWRWNISQQITFITTGAYTERDGENDWLINTLLSASYSLL